MVQEAKFATIVFLLIPGLHVSDEIVLACCESTLTIALGVLR